jgi:uncharacterized membrane protein
MSRSNKAILILLITTAFLLAPSRTPHTEDNSSIRQSVVSSLQQRGIPDELVIVFISSLPISELRGGIPLALYTFGMSFPRSYVLALIGNLIPVIPLLLFLTGLSRLMSRYEPLGRLLNWFFSLTRRRGGLIEKYEAVGLILFVATPLPVTGAWTGAVASVLFGLRFRYALPCICLGVMIAGLIVSVVCWLGIAIFA